MIAAQSCKEPQKTTPLKYPEPKFPLDVSAAGGKLFAKYVKDAVLQVVQYDLNGKKESKIKLPGLGTASGFNGKEEDSELYYVFTRFYCGRRMVN